MLWRGQLMLLGDDVKLVGREEVLTDVENCLCPLLHTFPLSFFLYYIWWFGIFSGTGTFRFLPRPFFLPSLPHPLTRIRNQKTPSARQRPSPFILYVHRFLFAPRFSLSREERISRYISLGNWLCPNTI